MGTAPMKMTLFLQDLSRETIEQIKWVVRHDLAQDMGIDDPEQVDEEAVDDYLNRNNVGIPIEL